MKLFKTTIQPDREKSIILDILGMVDGNEMTWKWLGLGLDGWHRNGRHGRWQKVGVGIGGMVNGAEMA